MTTLLTGGSLVQPPFSIRVMVKTRSTNSRRAAKAPNETFDSITDSESSSDAEGLKDVADCLEKLHEAVAKVKTDIKRLRKRKRDLEEELADEKAAVATVQARRGSGNAVATINKLENLVKGLQAENRKKEKTIAKMKRAEVAAEADDLLDTVVDPETGEDPTSRMRKLLRRFNDLMAETTLGDDDECPVCFEKLEVKKCLTYPCQHLICQECFKNILPDQQERYKCPFCRDSTPREDIESVRMTEIERWDELLKVARAWGAYDHRPDIDTSEEEAEENFLTDRDPDEIDSSEVTDAMEESDAGTAGTHVKEEEPSERDSTPSPRPSYFSSPSREKRRRLAELAEDRARKKRH